MLVVDTSALMAILLDEPEAASCIAVLEREEQACMSAGTLAEALIVAGRRGVAAELTQLIAGLGLEIVDVTQATAQRVAEAYARWGKGLHRASLNFGDCYAYAEAKHRAASLLYVGEDFAKTDIASAIARKRKRR